MIAASTLIDVSGEKEERSKSKKETVDNIDDDGDGYSSVDEEGGRSDADNNDGKHSTITKMSNNNISNSEGRTNKRKESSPQKLKLWYD